MNALTLEIYLPAALRSYEVRVPRQMQIAQLTPLVSRALSQLSGGLYADGQPALLCLRDSGEILHTGMTPEELGLRNGARLMLI